MPNTSSISIGPATAKISLSLAAQSRVMWFQSVALISREDYITIKTSRKKIKGSIGFSSLRFWRKPLYSSMNPVVKSQKVLLSRSIYMNEE